MSRIIGLLVTLLTATTVFAVDNNQTCTGNSCKVTLQPKTSGGAASTALTADVDSGTPRVNLGTLDFIEGAAPGTPSAGYVRVYGKTDSNLYFKTSAGTEQQVGSGSGEKSYTQTGASTSASWTASGAGVTVATTTTTSDLPRPNSTRTGIKFTGVSGSTAFGYYNFTLDDADYNKKLKLQFDLKPQSTYVAGDFKVDVYSCTVAWSAGACSGTSTRLALSTDSSAISAIPNLTGTYRTAFDSPGAAAKFIQLQIGLNATSTKYIVLSDLVVGPGTVTQGAAVSEWVSFSPTGSWTSNTTYAGFYRRDGAEMELNITASLSGAPTAAALTVNLPTGFTINTAALSSGGDQNDMNIGAATILDAATERYLGTVRYGTSTRLDLMVNVASGTYGTISTQVTNTVPFTFGSSDKIFFRAKVPIAEWAGNGTVNVVQNDCEYAYNTGTWDGDDETSFAYGPDGQLVPTSTNLTTARTKRVRFITPIQAGDQIDLEWKVAGTWMNPGYLRDTGYQVKPLGFITAATNAESVGAGIQTIANSATDVYAKFNHYADYYTVPSAAEPATVSFTRIGWSTAISTATIRWRVKKCAGGQATGFGLATATSAGLVNPYSNSGGVVYAGTYTATATGVTNISGINATDSTHYIRVGNTVTVHGYADNVDPAAAGLTEFRVTLPVASNFTSQTDLKGTSTSNAGATGGSGGVLADATNDQALITLTVSSASAQTIHYTFSYEVK